MWPDEALRKLKEKITNLSDEELLNIVEVEAGDYRKEALGLAKAELVSRGIEFEEIPVEDLDDDDEGDSSSVTGVVISLKCSSCGAETRPGILFADRELTILFSDKDEERFVQVHACRECGKVEMIVDYETEVRTEAGR